MGRMTELDAVDQLGRERGLQLHIDSNFYPPFPQFVKDSITEGFKQYWAGEIGPEELAEKCYLRDTDGLFRYFDCFLYDEEDEI